MIKVKSNLPPDRVALWDRNKAHPNGEVFIKGGDSAELEMTDGVMAAIRDGRLVQVGEVEPAPEAKPATQPPASTKKNEKDK